MKHLQIVVPLAAVAMMVASGCASTKHLNRAEKHFCVGQYEIARESAYSKIDREDEPSKLEKPRYILDNLYAGSTSLMCGDSKAAAEDFRCAGEGIIAQDESTFGSGYPSRAYDATMAANYRALALWNEGDIDGARVAFRLTADAQDKAEERNARAIREMEDDLEKRKNGDDGGDSPASGERAGQGRQQRIAELEQRKAELEQRKIEQAQRLAESAKENGDRLPPSHQDTTALQEFREVNRELANVKIELRKLKADAEEDNKDETVSSLEPGAEERESEDNSSGLAGNPEVASFQASFDDWAVYGDFQIPSAWFLDAVFAIANAEDANDLEHASFAARKAQSMAPSTPAATIYNMAEAVADGKIPRKNLDNVAVVVFDNGLGPRIDERRFDLPLAIEGKIYTISFALPNLVKRDVAYSKLVVRDGAVSLGETTPISDFDRVVVKEFKSRLPGIIASQIFEATIKVAIQVGISELVEEKWGSGWGFIASLVTSGISVAVTGTDTRHWNLLPKEVQAVVLKKPSTPNRTISLCVPGGVAPLATVDLPEKGLSVVYVRVPAPGLPPLVTVLGTPGAVTQVQKAPVIPRATKSADASGSSGWSPFGFSVINPIQIPWDDMDVYGLRLSVLYGRNEDVYGLDLGGLVSVADGDLWGLEFSGLVNSVGSSSGALQFAGLVNHSAGDFSGWQTAAIANAVGGSMAGIQIACVNLADELGGLQLGVYNQAGRASGLQIGVINYAESMCGIQIGAINIISDSPCPFLPVINICF